MAGSSTNRMKEEMLDSLDDGAQTETDSEGEYDAQPKGDEATCGEDDSHFGDFLVFVHERLVNIKVESKA